MEVPTSFAVLDILIPLTRRRLEWSTVEFCADYNVDLDCSHEGGPQQDILRCLDLRFQIEQGKLYTYLHQKSMHLGVGGGVMGRGSGHQLSVNQTLQGTQKLFGL